MKKKQEYYSYSQVNTFINCPQKYKLTYIDRIKSKNEGVEAFVGKIVHEVLETIYKNKIEYLIWDSVEAIYYEIWSKRWHDEIFYFNRTMLFGDNRFNTHKYKKYNQAYFKKLGLEYIRNYYLVNKGPDLNMSSVVDTEVSLFVTINNFRFKTIIDRIDKTNSSLEIHDYKTGKPKSKVDLKDDMQLVIYQLALEEKYPDEEIYLNWHYLKEKNIIKQHIRFKKNINEINAVISRISEAIESIIRSKNKLSDKNNFPAKVSFLCNWCYLWENCNKKQEYNEKNPAQNVR
jgi:putative RecB family exonuclease